MKFLLKYRSIQHIHVPPPGSRRTVNEQQHRQRVRARARYLNAKGVIFNALQGRFGHVGIVSADVPGGCSVFCKTRRKQNRATKYVENRFRHGEV